MVSSAWAIIGDITSLVTLNCPRHLYHVTVFWRLSSIFSLAHWCCRVRSTRSMKAECAGLWRGRCLCNGGSTSVITLVDIQQLNFDISNTYISNTMDILMCFLSPNHFFFFFWFLPLVFKQSYLDRDNEVYIYNCIASVNRSLFL